MAHPMPEWGQFKRFVQVGEASTPPDEGFPADEPRGLLDRNCHRKQSESPADSRCCPVRASVAGEGIGVGTPDGSELEKGEPLDVSFVVVLQQGCVDSPVAAVRATIVQEAEDRL
jgi:hypothetical protein